MPRSMILACASGLLIILRLFLQRHMTRFYFLFNNTSDIYACFNLALKSSIDLLKWILHLTWRVKRDAILTCPNNMAYPVACIMLLLSCVVRVSPAIAIDMCCAYYPLVIFNWIIRMLFGRFASLAPTLYS